MILITAICCLIPSSILFAQIEVNLKKVFVENKEKIHNNLDLLNSKHDHPERKLGDSIEIKWHKILGATLDTDKYKKDGSGINCYFCGRYKPDNIILNVSDENSLLEISYDKYCFSISLKLADGKDYLFTNISKGNTISEYLMADPAGPILFNDFFTEESYRFMDQLEVKKFNEVIFNLISLLANKK